MSELHTVLYPLAYVGIYPCTSALKTDVEAAPYAVI